MKQVAGHVWVRKRPAGPQCSSLREVPCGIPASRRAVQKPRSETQAFCLEFLDDGAPVRLFARLHLGSEEGRKADGCAKPG